MYLAECVGHAMPVEVLEEVGLPREISVAPDTETTDRDVAVDAHTPDVVGDSACERFDASDRVAQLMGAVGRCTHRPSLEPGRAEQILT